VVPYDWQWRQYITVLCDNMKAASETTKLVVVDVEAGPSRFACRSGFSREVRTFRFQSSYDHFVLRGTKSSFFLSPRFELFTATGAIAWTLGALTPTFSSLAMLNALIKSAREQTDADSESLEASLENLRSLLAP